MAATLRRARLGPDRRGAEETLQAVAAVTVVIACVGVVLAAVHAASLKAADEAARQRAALQAEIVLDELPRDPAVAAPGGAVKWTLAQRIAAGLANLTFVPNTVTVLTLRPVVQGSELFLVGSTGSAAPDLVFASHPIAIEMPGGAVVPGIVRAGLQVR